MNARQWSRDLRMGVRFAFTGGREGWIRVLLTAVGVGLGVALLLLTTAIPNALAVRDQRNQDRRDYTYGAYQPKGANTLVISDADGTFRGSDVRGRLVEPEGPRAPLPPGLTKYPAPGEMVVSPALKRLLGSADGKLLRERLPYRIVGTIAERGLVGSQELAYYAGAKDLAPRINGWRTARITHFGPQPAAQRDGFDPVLILLVLVVFVVLLTPVAVFIAAAVRFGGERRDRRLAALRLVGSDSGMTRRIAAGEALAGSLVGLVFGTGFFLLGRQFAGSVEIMDISVFPDYLDPSPALAALVALAVPAAAVLVTLFALRGVVIEPLGVVRTARPARRRLSWRLLLPLGGIACLAPMIGQGRDNGAFNEYLVIGGVLLLLVGVTALLPWVVEAVVARLGRGGVSWQLAVRRLQLNSGSAARMVNGIAVAVAGAIALQMLFAGIQGDYTKQTHQDPSQWQMQVNLSRGIPFAPATQAFGSTKGVRQAVALGSTELGDGRWSPDKGPANSVDLTVGSCAALRTVADLPSCRDGDAFVAKGGERDSAVDALVRPGRSLHLNTSDPVGRGPDIRWTVPHGLKQARAIKGPNGIADSEVLMTPAALSGRMAGVLTGSVYLRLDETVPDVHEYVRNTAARIDPLADAMVWASTERSQKFTSIRTGTSVGAVCVLTLIGLSLLVSQLEQLRERRKLLSSLVAFGTRRRTLSLSVLWQTSIPIALGLLLAAAVGLTLGTVLLKMAGASVGVDWPSLLAMTGAGAAVVLAVTLLSLPPLVRMMRPEGLRTE
ncbi:FtsX-like permease family protein [Streptomyces sp. NBC_00557]|uniref:FtsX-like permease family protein n=1 Tax=Streptomyces sp. NBC_00557 TaxID=2975776 RepID=UPI002E801A6B|nr:FtsX-like permease family protein [Streptomyces sp. NBC_00557]WUC34982.1 ABC transporter permease [Streptomyces sp. NBC_00557]